jgi:hypothetical protein
LQDFFNSTGKFNSIVVKTLKQVLCFSHDGVPSKFKKKMRRHYSLTVRIVSAWFQPLLNLAGQYLNPLPYGGGGRLAPFVLKANKSKNS